MTARSLRVLAVEDNTADARLMAHELRSGGYNPIVTRVETEAEFRAGLAAGPEIILSDYNLPQFGAPRALEIWRETGSDVPFLIVSGSIGEETAVAAIKQGELDYLLKDRLGRLGPAVTQALEQHQLRAVKQKMLREIEAVKSRLQHVLASSPAVLYTLAALDHDLTLTWTSDNVGDLFGYTIADEAGWWREHIHPEDRDGVSALLDRDLFAKGRVAGEYRFRHRRGDYRWVRAEMRLLRDADGRPVEVVGSWSDITERKRLEDQYRQSQKMEAVGRLAGGVAHDFNNLLTVINGYSELLIGSLHAGDPLADPILQVKKAGERAAALTRQLLAFSRKQLLVPVVLDLNALLADLARMLHRLIGEDVDLRFSPAADLGRVTADPGQLEQVILNLVVNARDAMPRGGALTLETANVDLDEAYVADHSGSRVGPYVRLAVSDTGCGMDAATLARVFEPFFTTKGPDKGTGLGLATVHGIVTQTGGHVDVYSEPGVGTTFKVYLPRSSAVPTTDRPSGLFPQLRIVTETILLVEDDDTVRQLTRLILLKQGYKVIEARHGAEALALSGQHDGTIHLMVTDVVMPNMSGTQLVERFAPLRPAMKVLYLSGYSDDAIVHHGVLTATAPFLQKPFGTDALVRKVRDVLDSG